MGRKVNPDASYLDIEKAFYKNKGKIVEVEEVPFEGSKGGSSSRKFDDLGLLLVRGRDPIFSSEFQFTAIVNYVIIIFIKFEMSSQSHGQWWRVRE